MVDKGQEFASSIRQNKKQSETNERTFLLPMLERTDHKLIVNSLHSEADRENARQAQHLAYVSEYTTDVQHLPGSSNFVADALSRQRVNAVFQHRAQMDWESLAKAQL